MSIDMATQAQITISVVVQNLEALNQLKSALDKFSTMGFGAGGALAQIAPEIQTAEKAYVQAAATAGATILDVSTAVQRGSEAEAQAIADALSTTAVGALRLAEDLGEVGGEADKALRSIWQSDTRKNLEAYGDAILDALGVDESKKQEIRNDYDSLVKILSEVTQLDPKHIRGMLRESSGTTNLFASLGVTPEAAQQAGKEVAIGYVRSLQVGLEPVKSVLTDAATGNLRKSVLNKIQAEAMSQGKKPGETVRVAIGDLLNVSGKTEKEIASIPDGLKNGYMTFQVVATKANAKVADDTKQTAIEIVSDWDKATTQVDSKWQMTTEGVKKYGQAVVSAVKATGNQLANASGIETIQEEGLSAGLFDERMVKRTAETTQAVKNFLAQRKEMMNQEVEAAVAGEKIELRRQELIVQTQKATEAAAMASIDAAAAKEKAEFLAGTIAQDQLKYNRDLMKSEQTLAEVIAERQKNYAAGVGLKKQTVAGIEFPEVAPFITSLKSVEKTYADLGVAMSDAEKKSLTRDMSIDASSEALKNLQAQINARKEIIALETKADKDNLKKVANARALEQEAKANYEAKKYSELESAKIDGVSIFVKQEIVRLSEMQLDIDERRLKLNKENISLTITQAAVSEQQHKENLIYLEKLKAVEQIIKITRGEDDADKIKQGIKERAEATDNLRASMTKLNNARAEEIELNNSFRSMLTEQQKKDEAVALSAAKVAEARAREADANVKAAKSNLLLEKSYEELKTAAETSGKGQLIAREVLDELNTKSAKATEISLRNDERQKKSEGQLTQVAVDNTAERRQAREKEAQSAADAANKMARDRIRAEGYSHEQIMSNLNTRIQYFERQLDAVFRAGFRLKMVGMDLKFAGDRAVSFIDQSVGQFAEFEYTLGRAAGTMGSWATSSVNAAANFSILQKKVLEASVAFRLFSAEETAMALYFLGSTTGQVVNEVADLDTMISQLTPIMKTAAMTSTGYETAIKGVYSVFAQFYPEISRFTYASGDYTYMAEKMTDVTQKLFYVTTLTAAEFPDLVNSFKMVGPVAAQAGAKFDDIVELLGRLADVGIRGTMAGRGLRQMFIQMVRPSPAATKALEGLFARNQDIFGGKTYQETVFPDGKFEGTTAYIRNLALALKDATDQYRSFVLARITTANELPILTALVYDEIAAINAGGAAVDKVADINAEAVASFNRSWSRLDNTAKAVMASLDRVIESVRITMGGYFAEAIKPFIKNIESVFKNINDWVSANEELIQNIGKVVAVFAGLLSAAGTVLIFAGSLVGLGAAIKLVISAFAPVVATLGGIVGVISAIIIVAIQRWKELEVAINKLYSSYAAATESIGQNSQSIINSVMKMISPFTQFANTVIDLLLMVIDWMTRAKSQTENIVSSLMSTLTSVILLATAYTSKLSPALKMVTVTLGMFTTALTQSQHTVEMLGKALSFYFGYRLLRDIGKVTGVSAGLRNVFTSTMVMVEEANPAWVAGATGVPKTISVEKTRASLLSRAASAYSAAMDPAKGSKVAGAIGLANTALRGLFGTAMRFLLTSPMGLFGILLPLGMAGFEALQEHLKSTSERLDESKKKLDEASSSFGEMATAVRTFSLESINASNQIDLFTSQVGDSTQPLVEGNGAIASTSYGVLSKPSYLNPELRRWLQNPDVTQLPEDLRISIPLSYRIVPEGIPGGKTFTPYAGMEFERSPLGIIRPEKQGIGQAAIRELYAPIFGYRQGDENQQVPEWMLSFTGNLNPNDFPIESAGRDIRKILFDLGNQLLAARNNAGTKFIEMIREGTRSANESLSKELGNIPEVSETQFYLAFQGVWKVFEEPLTVAARKAANAPTPDIRDIYLKEGQEIHDSMMKAARLAVKYTIDGSTITPQEYQYLQKEIKIFQDISYNQFIDMWSSAQSNAPGGDIAYRQKAAREMRSAMMDPYLLAIEDLLKAGEITPTELWNEVNKKIVTEVVTTTWVGNMAVQTPVMTKILNHFTGQLEDRPLMNILPSIWEEISTRRLAGDEDAVALSGAIINLLSGNTENELDTLTGEVKKREMTAPLILKDSIQRFENGLIAIDDRNANYVAASILPFIGNLASLGSRLQSSIISATSPWLAGTAQPATALSAVDKSVVTQNVADIVSMLSSLPEEYASVIPSLGLTGLISTLQSLIDSGGIDDPDFTANLEKLKEMSGTLAEKTTENAEKQIIQTIDESMRKAIESRKRMNVSRQLASIQAFLRKRKTEVAPGIFAFDLLKSLSFDPTDFVNSFKSVMISDSEGRKRSVVDLLLSDEDITEYLGSSPEVQAVIDYWSQLKSEMPAEQLRQLKALYTTGPVALETAKELISASVLNTDAVDAINAAIINFNKKVASGVSIKYALGDLFSSPIFNGMSLTQLLKEKGVPAAVKEGLSGALDAAVDAGIISEATKARLTNNFLSAIAASWSGAMDNVSLIQAMMKVDTSPLGEALTAMTAEIVSEMESGAMGAGAFGAMTPDDAMLAYGEAMIIDYGKQLGDIYTQDTITQAREAFLEGRDLEPIFNDRYLADFLETVYGMNPRDIMTASQRFQEDIALWWDKSFQDDRAAADMRSSIQSWSESLIDAVTRYTEYDNAIINTLGAIRIEGMQNQTPEKEVFQQVIDALSEMVPAGSTMSFIELWQAGEDLGKYGLSELGTGIVEGFSDAAGLEKITESAVGPVTRQIINQTVDAFTGGLQDRSEWKKAIEEANKKGTVLDMYMKTLKGARYLGRFTDNTAASLSALTSPVISQTEGFIDMLGIRKGPRWDEWRRRSIGKIVRGLRGQKKAVRDVVKSAYIQAADEGVISQEELYRMFPGLKNKGQELVDSMPWLTPSGAISPEITISPTLFFGEDGIYGEMMNQIDIAMDSPELISKWAVWGKSAGKIFSANFVRPVMSGGQSQDVPNKPANQGPIDIIRGWARGGRRRGRGVGESVFSSFNKSIIKEARQAGNAARIGAATALYGTPVFWSEAGSNIGKSWSTGFNSGLLANIDETLSFVGSLTIGDSPPKAGPLKNIDKGGYNVGNAWGSSMSDGAIKSLSKGARDIRRNIDAQNHEFAHRGNMDITMNRNDKKQIQISLNVTGDGSANRATMSELRKGLMDALVMADLEHMVEVI